MSSWAKRNDRIPETAYNVGAESSSSSTPKRKYDVFLSFRGEDTRMTFTDHLYHAFIGSGLTCFRDDNDIQEEDNTKQDLLQAIRDSQCAVVVLSRNYAESRWCLEELQMILECRSKLGQRVFPIFYGIGPSDVRGSSEEALVNHESRFRENRDRVQNWRNALHEISSLSGWDTMRWNEADLIRNVVGEVCTYLSTRTPSYYDGLVGIDSRVADMMTLLEIGLNDTFSVGIWGMAGTGKTTLARVVYEKLADRFEVCCFLANVRGALLQRGGLVSLQKMLLSCLKLKDVKISGDYEGMMMIRKLLSNKKLLLVLDDLDDVGQLKNLAESPHWFGRGSRIIITTRDKQLLATSGVERIYEIKVLEEHESLRLFSNKAFNKDHPEESYLQLSKTLVESVGPFPLALQVLGSFLHGRSRVEWRDTLDRLKQIPRGDILQALKLSYDGLDLEEKRIFLDIACFFTRWRKKVVIQILESCDLHPTIAIKVLIKKSLLFETKDHRLDMHNVLEDLGKSIVHQESPKNVGERSRLWKLEDIKEVLENNTMRI